jgi:hypothetical protein
VTLVPFIWADLGGSQECHIIAVSIWSVSSKYLWYTTSFSRENRIWQALCSDPFLIPVL